MNAEELEQFKKISKEEMKRTFEIMHLMMIVLYEIVQCSDSKDWHRKYGFVPDDRDHVKAFKELSLYLEVFGGVLPKYDYDVLTMILNLGDVQVDKETGSLREKYLNGYTDGGLHFKTTFGYDSLALAAKYARIFDHESEYEYNDRRYKQCRGDRKHKVAVSFNEMVSGLGIDKGLLSDEELYKAIRTKIDEFLNVRIKRLNLDENLRKKYEALVNDPD